MNATTLHISDAALNCLIINLCRKEREATHEFLRHLMEFDNRRLYVEQGYSSLFDFLTRRLGYSEGSAQRRILGARCMREHPELEDLFLEGKVTLCSISTAAGSIKREKTEIQEIVGKSKREVEALVAAKEPELKVKREIVRPIAEAPRPLPLLQAMAAAEAGKPLTATSEHRCDPPSVEERYEIKFSLSKAEYQELEEARNLLSNSLGGTLTVAAVLNKLVDRFLKPYRKSAELKSSDGRYIPASVRHEVYRRDRGECTYVAPDGTKCREKQRLQFDHIHPFSLGGRTEASNIRLGCGVHNRLWAAEYFGKFEVKESAVAFYPFCTAATAAESLSTTAPTAVALQKG